MGRLCAGTGADFYTSLMTEDGVMVLANGLVLDRAAVAVSLNETPPWSGYEISDARLVAAGDDSAILVYTGAAYRAGEPSVFRASCRVSMSGSKTAGGWPSTNRLRFPARR